MSSPREDLQECRQNETGVENPANKRADAHATPTLRNHWFCTKSDDRKVGGLSVGGCALHRRSSMSPRTRKCHRGTSSCLLSIFRDRRRCRKLYRFPFRSL